MMNSGKILYDLINEAKQRIWIAAVFIDNNDANLLLNVVKKGVKVKLLTTSQTDHRILKRLVNKGVKVKVYAGNLFYVKLCIVDKKAQVLTEDLLHEIDVTEAVKIFRNLWTSLESMAVKVAPKNKQLNKIYFKLAKSIVNGKEEIRFRIPQKKFEIRIVNPLNPPILMTIIQGSKILTTRSAYIGTLAGGAFGSIGIYNIEKNEWRSEALFYSDKIFRRIRSHLSPYVGDEEVIESLGIYKEFIIRFLDTVIVYLGTKPAAKVIGDKIAENLIPRIHKLIAALNLITQNHSLKIERVTSSTPAYSHINIINRECKIYANIGITFSIEPPLITSFQIDKQTFDNYKSIVIPILEEAVNYSLGRLMDLSILVKENEKYEFVDPIHREAAKKLTL
jgi:hypothetical protein